MAPMMTGMCRMVMEMGGIMMNPRGVKAITASRAMSRESWTRLRVFAVVLDIGINLLAAAPKGDAAHIIYGNAKRRFHPSLIASVFQ